MKPFLEFILNAPNWGVPILLMVDIGLLALRFRTYHNGNSHQRFALISAIMARIIMMFLWPPLAATVAVQPVRLAFMMMIFTDCVNGIVELLIMRRIRKGV